MSSSLVSTNPAFDHVVVPTNKPTETSTPRWTTKTILALGVGFVGVVASTVAVTLSVANTTNPVAKLPSHCEGDCQRSDPTAKMVSMKQLKLDAEQEYINYLIEKSVDRANARGSQDVDVQDILPAFMNISVVERSAKCIDGFATLEGAEAYECSNVDLLGIVSLQEMGQQINPPQVRGNDIWGWVDPITFKEYAIVGLGDGTGIVDVTVPTRPVALVYLAATDRSNSVWHDIKVYANHAFIVSEYPEHGMQVFDLTRVRDVTELQEMGPDLTYREFGDTHNIVINEETGYAYAVGGNTCSSGLHVVNIRDPKNPRFAGCFSEDGYVHDAQCLIYRGPDAEFRGQEICFAYNEDSIAIVDVTDKTNMTIISNTTYEGYGYVHQGWLSSDMKHMLVDDEKDERNGNDVGGRSTTYVFNVESLRAPEFKFVYAHPAVAIDHNLYVKGNRSYHANNAAGLRIADISRLDEGIMEEVAFFDTYPDGNEVEFRGSWSVYPYLPSGNLIVSTRYRGLFIVRPTDLDELYEPVCSEEYLDGLFD